MCCDFPSFTLRKDESKGPREPSIQKQKDMSTLAITAAVGTAVTGLSSVSSSVCEKQSACAQDQQLFWHQTLFTSQKIKHLLFALWSWSYTYRLGDSSMSLNRSWKHQKGLKESGPSLLRITAEAAELASFLWPLRWLYQQGEECKVWLTVQTPEELRALHSALTQRNTTLPKGSRSVNMGSIWRCLKEF